MPAMYWRVSRRRGKRLSTLILALLALLTTTVVLLSLIGHRILSLASIGSGDVRGRTTLFDTEGLGKRENQWRETVSWEPRAFLYHNFLSKEECEYLINAAKPHMEKAFVTDEETGENVHHRSRTNTGMMFTRGQDKVIRDIEKRIADYTFIPADHGEGLQVAHYEAGQKYDPHYDYFVDEINLNNWGQRAATVLMYLSDIEEGGETVFPYAKANSTGQNHKMLGSCVETGVSVKPRMGDALLFWNLRPDATKDPSSLHGACPVIKGHKWVSIELMNVNHIDI